MRGVRRSKVDTSAWTETEKAYLAGFIDGEGSICLNKESGKERYYPNIQLANTHKGIMEWVSTMLNSKLHSVAKLKSQKIVYQVRLTGALSIRDVLKAVFPYLRTKRLQARIALKECERIIAGDRVFDEAFYERLGIMNRLNRRGLDERSGAWMMIEDGPNAVKLVKPDGSIARRWN